MNHNITKTKQKLTNIFVALVFIIIFIFGITFFTAKYLRGVSIEKQEYSVFSQLLDSGRIHIEDMKRVSRFRGHDNADLSGANFRMSYIQFSPEGNIISSNIHESIDEAEVSALIERKKIDQFAHQRGFFFKKVHNPEDQSTYILFKEIRYTFVEYLWDVVSFLFLNLFLSILFYFIGKKFINKTFLPVEENIKDMKNFIHNAGHELKTPISVIDSNIQLMDDMQIYNGEMTGELKTEVLRLNSVIDGLIELSDIDSFQNISENNLFEIMQEVISGFKKISQHKDISIENTIPKHIHVSANRKYIQILLNNIFKNAITYNKMSGKIAISYKNKRLMISDTGIGIKKEDLDKIFHRFYKADGSRNSEGFGIGLSLVQKIADIYHWKITVESTPSKGSSFIIKM